MRVNDKAKMLCDFVVQRAACLIAGLSLPVTPRTCGVSRCFVRSPD